ncbi:MAG: septum formation protein Maf [Verrucomicrobia bacterium]|nr:septum formation protein Maf [Verrucomicrobiota bacterium]
MQHKLILGSGSPRRKEILSFFSVPFVQIHSDFDEETISFEGDAPAYAKKLAKEKGAVLARQFPKAIILTADTVVHFQGKIYNKPKSDEEAFSMLRSLSGNWHEVATGVAVHLGEECHTLAETTKILFNELTDEQIHLYQKACHCLDKAGGYAIQRGGSIIVSKIDGCYYNVMGLPIHAMRVLLLKMGIDLWQYLRGC